jgi:RNase H-like domain found in reverse transcriptase
MMTNHSKPFQIQVDSSLFATGDILTQIDTNRDRHPCAYLSKSLTKEQRNYDTGDRELLVNVTTSVYLLLLSLYLHLVLGKITIDKNCIASI